MHFFLVIRNMMQPAGYFGERSELFLIIKKQLKEII